MSMMPVDFNLLKVLDALLSEKSVSAAARRLGLSQPATSAALSRLRDIMGDPILVRRGNAMLLTAPAEEVRSHVARLVNEIAKTLESPIAFDPLISRRRFRILASEYVVLVLITPLAQRLRETAPNIVLEVLPFDPLFEERLAAQDCDLVISNRDFLGSARYADVLFTDSYVSVVRSDHPNLQGEVALEAFLAEDHAMVTSVGRAEGHVDKALVRLGRERRVVLTLPHFLAAPEIVAKTNLIITMPHCIAMQLARNWPLRMFVPPLDLAGFEVGLVRHPRSVGDPPSDWLRGEIISVSRQVAAGFERAQGHSSNG